MSGATMNMDLAAMYDTPGGPSQEDMQKVANAELFAKLAADNGIDLNRLTDDQVADLWTSTFRKTAEEEAAEAAEETEEEKAKREAEEKAKGETKESAAQREFMQKKAAQEEWTAKLAEADYLGRVMAHSYVQELGAIGNGMDKEAVSVASLASKVPMSVARRIGQVGEVAGKGLKAVGGVRGAAGLGGAGVLGYAAGKGSGKHASALDELAVEQAVVKAAEAGFDPHEAASRISAVATLGLGESEKIASADTAEGAVDIRALEYLEAAGYPITWAA